MSNWFRSIRRSIRRIARRSTLRIQTTVSVPPFVKVSVEYELRAENDNPRPTRRRKTA